RPARRAANEVRAADQPQDRESLRPHDPAIAAAAGGSGHGVMDRRRFVGICVGGLVVTHSVASAQPTGSARRIGYLSSSSNTATQHTVAAFRQGLRGLGWVEGQSIIVDYRYADGNYDRLPGLVDELVRLKVEVIVAGPTPPALAARKATRTIPIVIWALPTLWRSGWSRAWRARAETLRD